MPLFKRPAGSLEAFWVTRQKAAGSAVTQFLVCFLSECSRHVASGETQLATHTDRPLPETLCLAFSRFLHGARRENRKPDLNPRSFPRSVPSSPRWRPEKNPGARQMVRAILSVHDRSEPPSGPILGNRPRRAHPGHAPYLDARTIWRAPTGSGPPSWPPTRSWATTSRPSSATTPSKPPPWPPAAKARMSPPPTSPPGPNSGGRRATGSRPSWLTGRSSSFPACPEHPPLRMLRQCKIDSDLAGVRDPDALARLPEPDRKDWQALWVEVDELLRRAEAGSAPEPAPSAGELPAGPFAR
jgi:hypothetical protein